MCRNWVPDVVSNPGWCFGTPAAEKVSQSLKDVAGFIRYPDLYYHYTSKQLKKGNTPKIEVLFYSECRLIAFSFFFYQEHLR